MVSDTMKIEIEYNGSIVLILVLMEDGLGLSCNFILMIPENLVLILVLMEDGLGRRRHGTQRNEIPMS